MCLPIDPFKFNFHGLDNTSSDFNLPSLNYSLLGDNFLPLPSAFGMSKNHPLSLSHQSTGSLEHSTSRLVLPLPDSDIQSSTPAPVSGAFTDKDGAGMSATADANTSTWSARNPHHQVIPPHTSKQKQLSEAEHASYQIAAELGF